MDPGAKPPQRPSAKGEPDMTTIRPWRILIADDELDVHLVTKLALQRKKVFDRGIEFLSAYSGEEAKAILRENDDIACILLDVVMEREDSGLEVVKFIRDELGNRTVRIILRTGQPGQAPESSVILEYEINDYKQKTDLTVERLFSTVVTAIRSYRDIRAIEQGRKGMEMIIAASADMLRAKSIQLFAEGVLNQIISLLHISRDAFYIRSQGASASGFTARGGGKSLTILAGAGRFRGLESSTYPDALGDRQLSLVDRAILAESNIYEDSAFAIVLKDREKVQGILYIEDCPPLNAIDLDLIAIFCSNVSAAFSNILLYEELEKKVEERTRELKDAQARMLQQEKMASIGLFAAGIAHEVNNPIGFIVSNLSTLGKYVDKFAEFHAAVPDDDTGAPLSVLKRDLEIGFLTDDARALVKESLDGANRVEKIVRDLRVFSAVDAPQLAYADVNESIEATIDVLGDALRSKADVVTDLTVLSPVRCQPASLNLVLMNVLLNAAQAIEKRGTICIGTRKGDGKAMITIEDTGRCMAPEIIDRIFEPFFTTKEIGKGVGLGLTIAYETLKNFGGEIAVESELGVGSRFTITLPS
jgi:signal transduction histidine kinase/CheY-like chemotaxis protein